jgi:hypothetical protein
MSFSRTDEMNITVKKHERVFGYQDKKWCEGNMTFFTGPVNSSARILRLNYNFSISVLD